jgi:malonate transporter MadL subunit
MIIYGVAVLAACFMAGRIFGEYLGQLIGIDANVGGVGFSMILLILVTQWLRKVKGWNTQAEAGVLFWSNLYIPVIVVMSAIQNVKGALSSGMIAVLTGVIPTAICFMLVPLISRKRSTMIEPSEEQKTV